MGTNLEIYEIWDILYGYIRKKPPGKANEPPYIRDPKIQPVAMFPQSVSAVTWPVNWFLNQPNGENMETDAGFTLIYP